MISGIRSFAYRPTSLALSLGKSWFNQPLNGHIILANKSSSRLSRGRSLELIEARRWLVYLGTSVRVRVSLTVVAPWVLVRRARLETEILKPSLHTGTGQWYVDRE